ncbi:MAG: hypothetical protein WBQ86_14415 [Candidatus Binatus sp.]
MTRSRNSSGSYLFSRLGLALFLLIGLVLGAMRSAASEPRRDNAGAKSRLVTLAAAGFPNLTRAEVALLEHADVKNVGRAEYAASGPSSNPDDSSNEPANASQWGPEREIRASLIRWMSVDPDAIKQIDPQGIRVLGAKIVGSLDLSQVRVPFAIVLRNCAIPEAMELASAEIPSLDLQGSYTGSIHAASINVSHVLLLDEVHSTGVVSLVAATIGFLSANGGHFKYAAEPGDLFAPSRTVLNLTAATIKSSVFLNDGFESDGGVNLNGSRIGGDLSCISGHVFNPGNVAISAIGTEIAGYVYLMSAESPSVSAAFSSRRGGPVKINGSLLFRGTRTTGVLVWDAVLTGTAGTPHGFLGPDMSAPVVFFWIDVTLEKGSQLDLRGASVGYLVDDERSWPAPGNLIIDGFTYSGFGLGLGAPLDAVTRLKWIALQPQYHPQPYLQLAKVLREAGDEKGAVKVLVAERDASYRQMGLPGRVLGTFLKYTIGYGHRPLLALLWSLGVVVLGWAMLSIGSRAGVMAPSWPEHKPAEETKSHEELHPLLYSLDIFLPVVDLHQENYWWPDATASGSVDVFGRRITISGRLLRGYLWLQIIAGWLLSGIFIAGVTGLIRND